LTEIPSKYCFSDSLPSPTAYVLMSSRPPTAKCSFTYGFDDLKISSNFTKFKIWILSSGFAPKKCQMKLYVGSIHSQSQTFRGVNHRKNQKQSPQMFDCTGKSTNSRTRSVRELEAGGSGVARYSSPQRGPGRSPGNQRIFEHPYTQNYINKYIFYSKFR